MASEKETEQTRRAAIRSLFKELPEDFEKLHGELAAISGLFHEELAYALEPGLNAELQRRPHDELADKQAAASWTNHVLRDLRLAIRCPRTGQAAILLADWKDEEHDLGRFRLAIRDERGKSVKTFTTPELPTLHLREDRPRQHGSRRFKRHGQSGPGR